ncbi:hypothetical protein [uncultured Salinisphaera sp.]|uniref:hypothetical protein n=1 Tax=uncultured Salinisphaera sp. TaxID=359372 RepID=UPI0032B2E9DD|tara:strand:- start:110 stop:775 length:666 start_codon:yes stop_codon:yes gene_type:complete
MMKKTAIALGLAMVSSLGIAAQNGAAASAHANASQSGAGIDAEAAINTQFDALDTNGDGVLSRAEAEANPRVSALYDSMDTADTIEDRDKQSMPDGISREQFQAGMQAASSGSGSFGPAVSGGETYTIMRDGTRQLKQGASNAATGVREGAGRAASSAAGAAQGTANQAGAEARSQQQRMQQSQSMQNRAQDGMTESRDQIQSQRDRAQRNAGEMQQRARG